MQKIRDYRTFLIYMAMMLVASAGIMAFSVVCTWLLVGGWASWEQILILYGIMVGVCTIVLVYRLFTEWTCYDDDELRL